ncbi:hypothetical protein CAPTEDRAFT_26012, partial [Capitella teleta]
HEARLLMKLRNGYDARGTDVRPLLNSSELLTVEFGMRLITMNLNEATQTMTVSVYLRMKWIDQYLMWDPAEYDGLKYISMDPENVWFPRIENVNKEEEKAFKTTTGVSVKYNGKMFWTPHQQYTVGCLIDAREYPFDHHTCTMWFQQLTEKSEYLELLPYSKSPLDLSTSLKSFAKARSWTILENTTTLVPAPSALNVTLVYANRPAIKFGLTVRRRPSFKDYLILAPCILFPFIAAIVFTFPPEGPARMSISLSFI